MKTYYIASPLPIEELKPIIENVLKCTSYIHEKNNQVLVIQSDMEMELVLKSIDKFDIECIIINDEIDEWINRSNDGIIRENDDN